MKNFSSVFNIGLRQPELEFVDIKLNRDNPLFLDPRLIEYQRDPIAKKMHKRIEIFWAEVFKAIRAKDIKRTHALLEGMKEPRETRLGYASGIQGNNVGEVLKDEIITALQNSFAIKTGILSHFGDVELFIDQIGIDRISDITTKIIKDVLIEFTQDQCNIFSSHIKLHKIKQRDIFDYKTLKWLDKEVLLPVFDGIPIILVPKTLVRLGGQSRGNFQCFYRFATRYFIEKEPEMLKDISPSGKDGKLILRDVRAHYPPSKDSLARWCAFNSNLLIDFKSDKLNGRIHSLSDDEIIDVVYGNLMKDAG